MSDLRALIDRYNDAWNRHDVDAIIAIHAPGMVFENHTAGERAEGEQVRGFEDGLIKRKDVYSDSVGILRQVGLL
jgi:ketosteroid isomerase-like protein